MMGMKQAWRSGLGLLLLMAAMTAVVYAAEPGSNKYSVTADELEYDVETGEGRARGHVVLADNLGTARGEEATFNSKDMSGILKGKVVADRDGAHIECEEFIVYNQDDMTARGGALLSKEGKTLTAPRVDYFKKRQYAETIGGWAKLTDVDGSVMDARKIDYNLATGIAHAYDNVTFDSPARKMSGSADQVVYDTKRDGGVLDLIGHAKAVQDGNLVQGNKLRLTNNSQAAANGKVKIIYIPEQEEEAQAAPAEAAPAEPKQELGILDSYRAKRDAAKKAEEEAAKAAEEGMAAPASDQAVVGEGAGSEGAVAGEGQAAAGSGEAVTGEGQAAASPEEAATEDQAATSGQEQADALPEAPEPSIESPEQAANRIRSLE